MSKLEIFKGILPFLPELFPPDLSAITLSNCTHFIGIWGRPGNTLGESLKTFIYPGKPLEPKVMLGQVIMQKKKIVKYYSKEESISGIPYLAVGVPIHENGEMIGGICVVREETILETQERCKNLLKTQNILSESMRCVSSNLAHIVNSYREIRKIADFTHILSQKAQLMGIGTTLEASNNSNEREIIQSISADLQALAEEAKRTTENIVSLLNDFDKDNIELFTSIRRIETVVNNMSHTVRDILDYLAQESSIIMNGD